MFEILKLQVEQLWREFTDHKADLRREFTDHKAELREVRADMRGKADREELGRVYTDIGEKEAAAAERHRSITARLEAVDKALLALDELRAGFGNLHDSLRALAGEVEGDAPKPNGRKLNMQRVDWRILAFAFLAVGATVGKSAEMLLPMAVSIASRLLGG